MREDWEVFEPSKSGVSLGDGLVARECRSKESAAGVDVGDRKERLKSPLLLTRSSSEVDRIGDSLSERVLAGRLSGLSEGCAAVDLGAAGDSRTESSTRWNLFLAGVFEEA